MKKIRKGVFETNSSSTHSLSVSKLKKESYTLSFPDTLTFGEFGWGYERLTSPVKKAEYIITLVRYNLDYKSSEDYKSVINSKYMKLVIEAIKEKTGKKVDIVPCDSPYYSIGYIDHQSLNPDIFSKEGIDLFGMKENDFKEAVKEIIFNNSYVIHVDNDNH